MTPKTEISFPPDWIIQGALPTNHTVFSPMLEDVFSASTSDGKLVVDVGQHALSDGMRVFDCKLVQDDGWDIPLDETTTTEVSAVYDFVRQAVYRMKQMDGLKVYPSPKTTPTNISALLDELDKAYFASKVLLTCGDDPDAYQVRNSLKAVYTMLGTNPPPRVPVVSPETPSPLTVDVYASLIGLRLVHRITKVPAVIMRSHLEYGKHVIVLSASSSISAYELVGQSFSPMLPVLVGTSGTFEFRFSDLASLVKDWRQEELPEDKENIHFLGRYEFYPVEGDLRKIPKRVVTVVFLSRYWIGLRSDCGEYSALQFSDAKLWRFDLIKDDVAHGIWQSSVYNKLPILGVFKAS